MGNPNVWVTLILTSSSNVLIFFRIARVTGLYPYDVDNWTNFEIFKYRPGGVNNAPHTDYSTVAQGLLFLSNTQLGGNFIIPLLGIAVNPEPGSLVVWQNLDRNGDNDPRLVESSFIYSLLVRCSQTNQNNLRGVQTETSLTHGKNACSKKSLLWALFGCLIYTISPKLTRCKSPNP